MSDRRRATDFERVNIVRGAPWKDALISVLEPRSPYRPWRPADGLTAGEAVIAVVNTDPVSVLAGVGVIGADGDAGRALAGIDRFYLNGLLEIGTLNMLAPQQVAAVIGEYTPATSEALVGHTSLAAGRILLESGGTCTGCRQPIDLTGDDARDRIHIHTISALQPRAAVASGAGRFFERRRLRRRLPVDWPAALCDSCDDAIRAGGFSSFLDFKFALHPACPVCSAQLTMSTMYGLPAGPEEEPWIATMGCCVEPYKWCCAECDYQW